MTSPFGTQLTHRYGVDLARDADNTVLAAENVDSVVQFRLINDDLPVILLILDNPLVSILQLHPRWPFGQYRWLRFHLWSILALIRYDARRS